MTSVPKPVPLYRRPSELRRRLLGVIVMWVIRAYGAAGALSVALSDSENLGGKVRDAVLAQPNLSARYEQAQYAVAHREQVQSTLDYARDHAPDPQELDAAVQRSSETARQISTTIDEVIAAKDALFGIRLNNVMENVPRVKDHVQTALANRPTVESIRDLQVQAQDAQDFITQLNLQDPVVRRIYADLRTALDNFGSDEIAATLGVMGAALAIAWVLSIGVAFYSRRGRPGFVMGTLQRWGARVFRPWYAENLEYAMGGPMYAVARERIQRDLVKDPAATLDPETLAELERWFERRRAVTPAFSTAD